MLQRILYPGWDTLSFSEKTLVRRWLESFIRFKATGREVRILFDPEEQYSESVNDLLVNFQFDIVDSSSTTEGISLDEIFPPQARENFCHARCVWKCIGSPNPNCVRNCIASECK
jgi:hypothetical protein